MESEKRYAVWSGDEHHYVKEIKHIFNQKENHNGSKLRLFLDHHQLKRCIFIKG